MYVQKHCGILIGKIIIKIAFIELLHVYGRRKWQPTPVFLPGESQGQGSLVGCCLWGRTESAMTKVLVAAAAAATCVCEC